MASCKYIFNRCQLEVGCLVWGIWVITTEKLQKKVLDELHTYIIQTALDENKEHNYICVVAVLAWTWILENFLLLPGGESNLVLFITWFSVK